MKKTTLILLIAIFATTNIFAQNCFKYLPQTKGTVMETTHYDKKGKKTSMSTLTIFDKTSTAEEIRLDVKLESQSVEQDTVMSREYAYICKDGKLYVDMTSYLGNTLDAYQGMEIEVDGDNLELPSNPVAGQKLPGGTVLVSVKNQGIQMVKISVTLSNRVVEKLETLKTAAGEFKCFKISQNTETKIGFIKVKGSSSEWIAEGAGVVRSESYNKKGKLMSYSELSKLTK